MKKITYLKNSNKTEDKLLYVILKYNISGNTSRGIHRFINNFWSRILPEDELNYPYAWVQSALRRLKKRNIVQCYGQHWYINKKIFTCKLKKLC